MNLVIPTHMIIATKSERYLCFSVMHSPPGTCLLDKPSVILVLFDVWMW
jgi:hypothetical protein